MSDAKILKSMRSDANTIFHAGIYAVKPDRAIRQYCCLKENRLVAGDRSYPLDTYEKIFVIGIGKASGAMAKALEDLLGDRISTGIAIVKAPYEKPFTVIRQFCAAHPVPDRQSHEGAEKVISLLETASKKDLVIFLISGGGSSLVSLPLAPMTLGDKQRTVNTLLKSGATIHEINTIRKHISGIKGGHLALKAAPAHMLTLILSDVIGDDLDVIASGLTVPDASTFSDCQHIIRHYKLEDKLPKRVIQHIHKGLSKKVPETPKADLPVFKNIQNLVIGNNQKAMAAAKVCAESLGYHTLLLSSSMEGEAKEVARFHTSIAKEILSKEMALKKPACLISGGETTVTIKGNGLGGRNMEFALAAAIEIAACHPLVCLSAGTDGTDGPTDATGAIVDGNTIKRASDMGMDASYALQNNDAYHFFKPLNDLLLTGPTHTNVMDLKIFLIK